MTNRFREDQAQYSNARALALDEPTDDPIRVIRRAKELLRAIYRPGYSYQKGGRYPARSCDFSRFPTGFIV